MNKPNTTGILFGVIAILVIIIIALLFWKKPFTPNPAPITEISQVQTQMPQQQGTTSNQTITEQQTGQPALVKGVEKKADGTYTLSLDIVSFNPNFVPGNDEPYLVNQSTKVRTYTTTPTTKFFACGPDSPVPNLEGITAKEIVIQEENGITTMVQGICLP